MANLSSKTGFSPVQTRVTLANNATTTVQNFAAYDAQELTGHVYVDATTDYRAAVKVTIFKNGAGTYEIAISDVAGDLLSSSPIVSFSISSAGVLSATLPNFAGYSTAYIQFNLNAPALGGQFPLQVDGQNVTLVSETTQGVLLPYSSLKKIRVNGGNGYGGTNTMIRRFTTTIVNTGSGANYSNSISQGASVSITESGIYAISYTDTFSAAANFGISLNTSEGSTPIDTIIAADRLVMGTTGGATISQTVSVTLALIVGDVIRPHGNGTSDSITPVRTSFTVQRIA